MYIYSKDKSKLYPVSDQDENESTLNIPPGVWEFDTEQVGLMKRPVFKEAPYKRSLVELKGKPFDSIRDRVLGFVNKNTLEVYRDFGTKHFLGVLLYGPPGTGKTCFLEYLALELVKDFNAVCIRVNNIGLITSIVEIARKNPDTPIVIMLEELDQLLGQWNEYLQEFLLITDGYKTPDNVIIFSTTNHYNKLPSAITSRPSRIGVVEEIDTIPQEIVLSLVKELTPTKYTESKKVNFGELAFKISEEKIRIDHIKHILLNVYAYGLSVDESIEIVKKRQKDLIED